MQAQRRKLRSKGQEPTAVCVVEWLLAKAIPGEEDPPSRSVEQRESEHPIQADRKLLAPLGVAVDQHFRVRVVALEAMPLVLQLGSELDVIVDLAVVDDAQCALGVPHGLSTALQVEYGEPAVADVGGARFIGPEPLFVRAPVGHGSGHRNQVDASTFA